MKDRVPLYPGRVKLTPVSGQENTYDMVRADEPTQEGDPLSKATFMKDDTAALFGLGSDAVPDDALALLSRFQAGLGNEYVWEKTRIVVDLGQSESVSEHYCAYWDGNKAGKSELRYANTAEDLMTGKYETINDSQYASQSAYVSALNSVLPGKYYATNGYQMDEEAWRYVYFCPQSCVLYAQNQYVITAPNVSRYPNATKNETVYGFKNSPNKNAYPPDVSDGYKYKPGGQLGAKAQIATGQYVGTGNSITTLTFPFEPKVVFVNGKLAPIGYYATAVFVRDGIAFGVMSSTNFGMSAYEITWVGNSVSWKVTSGSNLNVSGETYVYAAIS